MSRLGSRFLEAATAPEAAGRLTEAALCLAASLDPDCEVDAELAAWAELAGDCPGDLPGLRTYLFDTLGFRGDPEHVEQPRNSLLHEVRRRRRGIPISLCVVAMDVGRRAGVPLVGIGLPGHFLARAADDPSAYLDAFSGRLLTRDGVAQLFAAISGGVALDDRWLGPVDPVAILRRMLRNLRAPLQRRFVNDSGARLLTVLELEMLLPGADEEARVARAACLARMLRSDDAVSEFEAMAAEAESAGDPVRAAARLSQARSARSVLN